MILHKVAHLRICRARISCTATTLRSRFHSTDTSHEEFFRHTTYRFLHREQEELSRRYLSFNVDGLKAAAARAGGATSVVAMRKFTEGEFNKAFLMTLDNGKEVVGRLPLPKAGPSQLVVANEVATMDFARTHMDVPIPKVLSWEANSGQNSVEKDYMIMEKAEGVELNSVWAGLTERLRRELITELVKLEKKFTKTGIEGGYGGLYYRRDAEKEKLQLRNISVDGQKLEKFVLGPATQTSFWRDGKTEMDIERGPWDSALSYLLSVASRERAWVSHHAVHNEYPTPFDPPTDKPEAHIALLDKFTALAPYLVPPSSSHLKPTLAHRDLNTGNIFICDQELQKGKIKLTAIIDWQHTMIQPFYLAARAIPFLESPNVSQLPFDLTKVDFNALTSEQLQLIQPLFEQMKWAEFYKTMSHALNQPYHDTYFDNTRTLRVKPLLYAGMPFPKHYHPFRESLFEIIDKWDQLTSGSSLPCPIYFTEEEISARESGKQIWEQYVRTLGTVDGFIGMGCREGKVKAENYDDAVKRNKEFMELYVEELKKDVPEEAESAADIVPTFWVYRPWENDQEPVPELD
ncbi:hypothetical protein CPB83DRAFT_871741 [Crepidotus variabilis]|uniref:Altered inheritance of mitochondria protein 9, mitochondrial n=1 Tax=Crepidotus variabilis TaxID=179855 RepID=A0A9P6JJP2_9AGAR|nr:hypothetical protein CPB83DRAFT_871741 [Crepidotus variabilis]